MSTWICRFDSTGDGPSVAVKDLFDVAGCPTTAGSRAIADAALPAAADAACLAGFRQAGARLLGKSNLHELAFGTTGINPWFGTPTNPLDPRLVPGGSSSGSAVAVGVGEADVGLGSDTGGSVRIPAACSGVVGLKTTHGRIPLEGVWPLAPSLDTVGPLAADVTRVALGMALLEPGFAPASAPAGRVARLDAGADPAVEAAVDRALAEAELTVAESLPLEPWELQRACMVVLRREAWEVDGHLVELDGVAEGTAQRVRSGQQVTDAELAAARNRGSEWRRTLDEMFARVDLLALPTLVTFPPALDDAASVPLNLLTAPFNLAGVPAISVPVPSDGPVPASLQLVGPAGSEALLVATAATVEAALR